MTFKVGQRVRLRLEAVPHGFTASREGVVVKHDRAIVVVKHDRPHRWVEDDISFGTMDTFGWAWGELEPCVPYNADKFREQA